MDTMQPTGRREPADQYAHFDLPAKGFRNYWYPVMMASRLRRKPRAVRILGEDIVLFRDGGAVHALHDRCPHRGAKLSAGKCQFAGSGTISCPYHGWTFKGGTGECVAAIMEGPDSKVPGAVRVRPYPAVEHSGMIWLFIGDIETVPFEEDVLDMIIDKTQFFTITSVTDYACNWRLLTDNWTNEHHGPYVHGNSPELVFQPLPPFNLVLSIVDHGNGRSIGGARHGRHHQGRIPRPGQLSPQRLAPRAQADRPRQPRELGPVGGGARIRRADPQHGPASRHGRRRAAQRRLFPRAMGGPDRRKSHALFNINCFRRRGTKRALYDRIHYAVWRGWAHDWIFSGEDKTVVESVVAGRERLSKTDIGVIGWRKFASANARRTPAAQPIPEPEALPR
ncbi:MAG: Rieske 2Fe-2S domain-containing protein [Acetobacteraceae bacterium]